MTINDVINYVNDVNDMLVSYNIKNKIHKLFDKSSV